MEINGNESKLKCAIRVYKAKWKVPVATITIIFAFAAIWWGTSYIFKVLDILFYVWEIVLLTILGGLAIYIILTKYVKGRERDAITDILFWIGIPLWVYAGYKLYSIGTPAEMIIIGSFLVAGILYIPAWYVADTCFTDKPKES